MDFYAKLDLRSDGPHRSPNACRIPKLNVIIDGCQNIRPKGVELTVRRVIRVTTWRQEQTLPPKWSLSFCQQGPIGKSHLQGNRHTLRG